MPTFAILLRALAAELMTGDSDLKGDNRGMDVSCCYADHALVDYTIDPRTYCGSTNDADQVVGGARANMARAEAGWAR